MRGDLGRRDVPVSVGIIANPPRRPITRTISRPAPAPTAPAATRLNSNHWAATRSRLRAIAQRARSAPAAAKGTAASRMATVSAMITQVSSTPIVTGVYQRRGARSSTRKRSAGEPGCRCGPAARAQLDAAAELRRQHDPGGYQRPGPAFPAACPPLGEQPGQDDEERVMIAQATCTSPGLRPRASSTTAYSSSSVG